MQEIKPNVHEPDLVLRIESDYREMPGLSLTLAQAARLWQIDLTQCAGALNRLAESGILRQVAGRYLWTQGGM